MDEIKYVPNALNAENTLKIGQSLGNCGISVPLIKIIVNIEDYSNVIRGDFVNRAFRGRKTQTGCAVKGNVRL